MDLEEGISEVAKFNSNRSVWGVDSFFFATEGSAFDPLHAESESRGFTKDYGGEFFSVRWFCENGEKMSGAPLFHKER